MSGNLAVENLRGIYIFHFASLMTLFIDIHLY